MKINKLIAVGAILALAAGAAFGFSLAASAEEVPVSIDDIGTETSPYTAGEWFLGNPVGPALTQDATGLTIPGQNQLLYGQSISVATGAAFTALIDGAAVDATGVLTFQVPVFFNDTGTDTDFTTLRPETTGSPTTAGNWISSQDVLSLGLTAGTPVPFATIAAAFDASGEAEVLAFGVFVDPGQSAVLSSVTWGADTWTFATPVAPPTTPTTTAPGAPAPTPVPAPATFTG